MRPLRPTAVVLLAALPLACASLERCRDHRTSQQSVPADPAEAGERIAAWLDCDECTDAQLAAVVDLGEAVVPSLAATLREGLSPAYRARSELQLRDHYAARRARGLVVPGAAPALDEDAYVAQQIGGWDALHRARAATALGRIGGDAARRALRDALRVPQRPSVEIAVRAALDGAH